MGIDDLIFKTNSNTKLSSHIPIDIFNYLDKKEGYGYLRQNQSDFLTEWDKRRDERDIVGVMHTGAGKTLVGLLMLQSKMVEEQMPVLYLCPTVQLVEQVCEQAINYGLNVCKVDEKGQLPEEFLNSEKILVATFSKLFNGRTLFGNKTFSDSIINLGSILIDDAHSCVDFARNNSTITIQKQSLQYQKLLNIFKNELNRQSNGKLKSIVDGDYSTCMKVPYWTWKDNLIEIKKLINEYVEESNSDFEYRMLSESIDFSSCFISGTRIDITPKVTPLEQIPSYFKANHRYILSATINERDLCYELGIEKQAIRQPIITSSYIVDVGERLIISPSKYHKKITDELIRQWVFLDCKTNKRNLVIIVPSQQKAKKWKELGAKVIDNVENGFDEIMNNLKSGENEQIVLVNRYDGIDFSGDLSHMLILDGMPVFSTNKERADANTFRDDRLRGKLAQKIEQGMGRTVRSNSDYSVVILLGESLTKFVSLKKNLLLFSPATKEQLKISNDIISDSLISYDDAIKEIAKSINYCLQRKDAWVKYSKNQLLNVSIDDFSNEDLEKIYLEYESFQKYKNGNILESQSILDKLKKIVGENQEELGEVYQEEAEILYEIDRIKSENLQKLSADVWDGAFKPQNNKIQRAIKDLDMITEAYNFIKEFADKISYTDFLSKTISNLVYDNDSSSEYFEEAIKNLGKIMGLESQRPERLWDDGGPDNLWLSKEKQIVIECKNQEMTNINKDDIKQLGHSHQWYINKYGNFKKPLLLLFNSKNKKEHNVQVSDDMYVLDKEKLLLLNCNMNKFKELVLNDFDTLTLEKLKEYLNQNSLLINSFISTYMKKIR